MRDERGEDREQEEAGGILDEKVAVRDERVRGNDRGNGARVRGVPVRIDRRLLDLPPFERAHVIRLVREAEHRVGVGVVALDVAVVGPDRAKGADTGRRGRSPSPRDEPLPGVTRLGMPGAAVEEAEHDGEPDGPGDASSGKRHCGTHTRRSRACEALRAPPSPQAPTALSSRAPSQALTPWATRRPSAIAHTTSDCPRDTSPAAKTPGTLVAPSARVTTLPRASSASPSSSTTPVLLGPHEAHREEHEVARDLERRSRQPRRACPPRISTRTASSAATLAVALARRRAASS